MNVQPLPEVRTTCPYCGVGCGVIATPGADGVQIRGDESHPANYGRLCSKGAALGETLDLDGRLLYPEVRGARCDWDTALSTVADGFARIIREHGRDAVAFYVSGQCLTEDYYIANKFMKGYIGSANIDTNSRLCMASSVAGHKRAFGSDTVPCSYEDLERANLIVLVGSNAAWCHPVLFQRITQAREENPDLKIVVIDPRRTATCAIADLHLPLRPGTDAVLFNGLLSYLARNDYTNHLYVDTCTEGMAQALHAANNSAPSVHSVAQDCELDEEAVEQFFRLFACTEKSITVYSQGINQSSSGTDKVNAIINCHLLTGRIGRPGMGPFSFTGQPNAMGGREVGGMANYLAAHMDIANPEHRDRVQRFWRSPTIADKPGLKAVELFEAIEAGTVKAVWIIATNPVVSLPDADRVRAALAKCELVVVSDCVRHTDTTALAHVLLPALAWGEKDGSVTNSERRISRQRKFLAEPGEAHPDWWALAEVAKRMGYADGFSYASVAEVFSEHARLSGFENNGTRDFNIAGLGDADAAAYENLQPIQWPVPQAGAPGTKRMFSDGRFFTATRKAQFIAITPRAPVYDVDDNFPFVLNSGRMRDHWHTLTRTGKSARLSAHSYEPTAQLNPQDAAQLGVQDGMLVRLHSRWGEMIARAALSADQRCGSVFVPFHWNDQFASQGRVDALVNPVVDPISGQPESKHTPVRIAPYLARWHGFLLSRRQLSLTGASYWARAIGKGFWRYELAGEQSAQDWPAWARELLCAPKTGQEKIEWIEYLDNAAGRYRGARLVNNSLESCIFIAPGYVLPSRTWLMELFAQPALQPSERASLLAGRPMNGTSEAGPVVCACFNVGLNTLIKFIQQDKPASVTAISLALKAGSNCGSCIPELKSLLVRSLVL
ncbi:MAG: molybdopterin-dependent oxidoreductase [Gammaproteobacteria bacterium]